MISSDMLVSQQVVWSQKRDLLPDVDLETTSEILLSTCIDTQLLDISSVQSLINTDKFLESLASNSQNTRIMRKKEKTSFEETNTFCHKLIYYESYPNYDINNNQQHKEKLFGLTSEIQRFSKDGVNIWMSNKRQLAYCTSK